MGVPIRWSASITGIDHRQARANPRASYLGVDTIPHSKSFLKTLTTDQRLLD